MASRSADRTAAPGAWSAPPSDITEINSANGTLQAAQTSARKQFPANALDSERSRIALRARARIRSASAPAPTTSISTPAWSISRRPGRGAQPAGIRAGQRVWPTVVHPDDRPQHTRMIAALYKGEIPRLDIEFRYRGTRRHVALGAPARHRGARTGRPRAPHGRRDRRHHRDAPARAPARRREGRSRRGASRRRAGARDHADRARQHDRRRHAVRQGFPLAVSNRAPHRRPRISARAAPSRRTRPRAWCATRSMRGDFGELEDLDTALDEIAERMLSRAATATRGASRTAATSNSTTTA